MTKLEEWFPYEILPNGVQLTKTIGLQTRLEDPVIVAVLIEVSICFQFIFVLWNEYQRLIM